MRRFLVNLADKAVSCRLAHDVQGSKHHEPGYHSHRSSLDAMKAVDPHTLPVTSERAHRLQCHVAYLASPELKGRKPGTPGNAAAAQYIVSHFTEAGLLPLSSLGGYTQLIHPDIGDNVIGVRFPVTGTSPSRWILIGAHFDHLGESRGKIYAGADDNASAVAILIELAKESPALHQATLGFIAFNSEEPPYIRTPQMGSQFFVDHLPPEIGSPDHIQAAIIMDLMGGVFWKPVQETIFAAGAERSPGLYRHLKALPRFTHNGHELLVKPVGLHGIEEIPFIGRVPVSDYDAFRNVRVPFLFLSAGRTPRYHRPTDLPDTLYYERMALTQQWLRAILQRLDDDPQRSDYDDARMELADEVDTFRPLLRQAAQWETRIPGTSPATLLKLKRDAQWLESFDPAKASPTDIARLERISLRLQCLLADIPLAFLL